MSKTVLVAIGLRPFLKPRLEEKLVLTAKSIIFGVTIKMKEVNMKIENKRMGDLKVGDKLIGSDGQTIEVTQAYDEHIPKKMYEIEMEDGQVIKSSGNHFWYCETDTDRKEKRKYAKAAKAYFKNHILPAKDPLQPAYPLMLIGEKFASTEKNVNFIQRVAQSLGPSVSTPSLVFDNYMDLVEDDLIFTYSFNDMIDFLELMKNAVTGSKNEYFYFGKVRTADEIYGIIDTGNINIPEKGDISNGNS